MEDGGDAAAVVLALVILSFLAIPFLLLGLVFQKTRSVSFWLLAFLIGVYSLFSLLSMIVPGMGKKKSLLSECASRLHRISRACTMYSMDHNGDYPASFTSIVSYISEPELFVCPVSKKKAGKFESVDAWSDYVLVTNLNEKSASNLVLAYCRPGNHQGNKGTYVLSVDGSCNFVGDTCFSNLTCDILNNSRVNDRNPQAAPETADAAPKK